MSGFQRCVRYCILLLIPLSAIAGFGLAVVFMGLGHASRIHYEIAIPVTLAFSLPNVLAFFSFGRRNILAHGYIVLYFLAHLALCVYTYMLIKNNIGDSPQMGPDPGVVIVGVVLVVLVMLVPSLALIAQFMRPSKRDNGKR